MLWKSVFIAAFCVLLIGSGAWAETKPTIAVVDFTNDSGRFLGDIEEASAEILSTLLVQAGQFEVAEREKLKSILLEQNFVMSGLVDSGSSVVQIGKLLGADYLITGSILSYESNRVQFQGYGISSEKMITELTVSVKVLDVATGQIELAAMFADQNAVQNTSGVTSSSVDRALLTKVLISAVNQLSQEFEAKKQEAKGLVNVTFTSNPNGADVEIDNVYYGSTPLVLPIKSGLHHIRISLVGYEAWEKTISASEGLAIKATLAHRTK